MKTLWLALCLLCVAAICHADRDIVYSARYYAPPGSHRTSRFHIYRISPDGTGKTQLTFGNADDYRPKWSPDGRHILFIRADNSLYVMGANGGSLYALLNWSSKVGDRWVSFRWMPDGEAVIAAHSHVINKVAPNGKTYVADVLRDAVYLLNIRKQTRHRVADAVSYLPSSDGKCAYITNGSGEYIREIASGINHRLQYEVTGDPVWLDNETLVGQIGGLDFTPSLRFLGIDGHEKGGASLALPAPYVSTYLWGTPDPRKSLVYVVYKERTAGSDCLFYRFAPRMDSAASLNAAYLTECQFLAWSPDGSRFCTAPGRGVVPPQSRRNSSGVSKVSAAAKNVPGSNDAGWSAPLYIRAAAGGKMRQLTPRLSWVTFADWRKDK